MRPVYETLTVKKEDDMHKIFKKNDHNYIDILDYLNKQDLDAFNMGGTFNTSAESFVNCLPGGQYQFFGDDEPIVTINPQSFITTMHHVEKENGFQLFGIQ